MQLKAMYIPSKIVKEFITEFHKGITQRHNKAIALIARLGQKYIVKNAQKIARKVIKEYPDCQRNKFLKQKPFRELQPIKTLKSFQV